MSKRRKRCITLTFYCLLIAVSVFFFTKYFTTIKFEGDSMNNTYKEKDLLLIKKGNDTIKRGDVIVYATTQSETVTYIVKRVVGLPGETVSFGENDEVYINDVLLDEPYIYLNDHESFTSNTPFVVGENEYFCLGDNRHHSIDSRSTGSINKDRIYGKVIYKLWPVSFNKIKNTFDSYKDSQAATQ